MDTVSSSIMFDICEQVNERGMFLNIYMRSHPATFGK